MNVIGPSSVGIDSSAVFAIDFTLLNFAQKVYMEVLADNFTSDPVMTVCFLGYLGTGNVVD